MDYKMKLTDSQRAVLDGKEGEVKALMMETLVRFGDIFGAKRLVPVTHKSGHLVTSFGIGLLKPLYRTMDRLIAENVRTEAGFTLDPRPVDYKNVKCSPLEKLVFNKILYSNQAQYEEQLKKVGLKGNNAFTCTSYLPEVGNIPKEDDILSWAESSAVVYANSVLGARCNRNSGMLDLFGSILGCVPEFGFITDEGRKASWIVKVETSTLPEAQILGSAIGMKVMEDVPYVIGLDKFLGGELTEQVKGYLKDFGAATASNGAVGLYHIDGLTPEAKKRGHALVKENAKIYVVDDAEIERVYKGYPVMWKDPDAPAKLCFVGCPHLSFGQLCDWTEKIVAGLKQNGRKKVAVRTVLCAAPDVAGKFKKTDGYARLTATGATLTSICPLMYTNNPLTKSKTIATCSNKLRTYSAARYYKNADLLTIITGGESK